MKKQLDITKSNKIFNKAKKLIPGGSQTFSKSPSQFVQNFSPKYLHKGKGAEVWDVDNNKFIDYVMGCHPLILGYADKDVNKAVKKQLDLGSTFSLMNELELDVSKLLVDAIPSAEMVRFGKNGADATTIGVKIARAVTNRDHIALCGFHGWHDWFIATTDLNRGIPKFNEKLAHKFVYNDIDSLEKIFKKNKDKIAIVILEPLTVLKPKCYGPINCNEKKCKKACANNFLTEVKRITHKYGALLMFDEIISGFRFSFGGAQELVNVKPDLSSFAKAISNGIPLSAIVGKREYMECLQDVFFSFTYGGDCVGLSAAKACIPKIKDKSVINHLYVMGKYLMDEINNYAEDLKIDDYIKCIGYSCRSVIKFDGQGKIDELVLKSFFQQELLKRGVLWAAYHALSWSHKKKHINHTIKAFKETMDLFRKILNQNIDIKSLLEGPAVEPVFRKVADFNSFTRND